MAHYQNQYGGVCRKDAYGNPVDEYGNPLQVQGDEFGDPTFPPTGTATGAHGTTAGLGTTAAGTYGAGTDIGTGEHHKEQHGVSGMLHRSGSSSSSSSSEDDGQGGRRKKKGLKEKIKEQIPGVGHKENKTHATSATGPGGYHAAEEHHEKKGVMEKIKEKLPGHHHEHH